MRRPLGVAPPWPWPWGPGPPGPTLQKVAPDTVPGSCVGLLKPPKSGAGRGPKSGAGQDKGSPDNTSRLEAASKWTRVRRTTPGFAGQPARLEAASKWTRVRRTTPGVRRTTLHDLRRPPNWTRVCRTTLHDLRRPPNAHGFDKDSPDSGPDDPRGVLQLAKGWAAPTLDDLRRPLTTQGLVLPKPKIGKSMTRPFGPEHTPNAKPKFCPTRRVGGPPSKPKITRIGAFEAKDRKINDRALRPRTYPQRKT